MSMRRAASELAFRIKATVVAGFLGAWFGLCGWLWWLAEQAGGSHGWNLKSWLLWAWQMFAGTPSAFVRGELLTAAGVGAALLAAPLVYLFFIRRSGGSIGD